MSAETRSGAAVAARAQGSYSTSPRDAIIDQVRTMSSPIASGQPPTARTSSIQYAEKAPWATRVLW